jgi:TPR repeat protein
MFDIGRTLYQLLIMVLVHTVAVCAYAQAIPLQLGTNQEVGNIVGASANWCGDVAHVRIDREPRGELKWTLTSGYRRLGSELAPIVQVACSKARSMIIETPGLIGVRSFVAYPNLHNTALWRSEPSLERSDYFARTGQLAGRSFGRERNPSNNASSVGPAQPAWNGIGINPAVRDQMRRERAARTNEIERNYEKFAPKDPCYELKTGKERRACKDAEAAAAQVRFEAEQAEKRRLFLEWQNFVGVPTPPKSVLPESAYRKWGITSHDVSHDNTDQIIDGARVEARMPEILAAANAGDPVAIYLAVRLRLAQPFESRSNLLQDVRPKLEALKRAASMGLPAAYRLMAWESTPLEFYGQRTKPLFGPTQLAWLEMAASLKDIKSMFQLHRMYRDGTYGGVNQDFKLSHKWLFAASNLGSGEACLELATLYWAGRAGLSQDWELAEFWARRGVAATGSAPASVKILSQIQSRTPAPPTLGEILAEHVLSTLVGGIVDPLPCGRQAVFDPNLRCNLKTRRWE